MTNARTQTECDKRIRAYNRGYLAYQRSLVWLGSGIANPYHPQFQAGELKSWNIGWDDAAANRANGIANDGEWAPSGEELTTNLVNDWRHRAVEAMKLKR